MLVNAIVGADGPFANITRAWVAVKHLKEVGLVLGGAGVNHFTIFKAQLNILNFSSSNCYRIIKKYVTVD